MVKRFLTIVGSVVVFGALLFLFFTVDREVVVTASSSRTPRAASGALQALRNLVGIPEAPARILPTSSPQTDPNPAVDLPRQPKLENPSSVVKAIYITSWSAGAPSRINSVIDLIDRTELNAVVIDIKDYSGYAAYKMDVPEVAASGALDQIRILRPNALVKRLHDKNIYVIGRISVFQDPILAKAHPEWAVKNKATGKVWTDRKGLAWMDAAAKPVWDYNLAIARDAAARGFDEINFDYIRFPSDGDLENMTYSFWDERTPRHVTIRKFFEYVRSELPDTATSADLFGLVTVNSDDLGIGQKIENAYANFDYVSPMIYPSHYAPGFLGYRNPAAYPYEVVKYSLESALNKLQAYRAQTANTSTATSSARASGKLRPWLQDFDLGATYDAAMVKKQIQATEDVLRSASGTNDFVGWYMWDPANTYTEGALLGEGQ